VQPPLHGVPRQNVPRRDTALLYVVPRLWMSRAILVPLHVPPYRAQVHIYSWRPYLSANVFSHSLTWFLHATEVLEWNKSAYINRCSLYNLRTGRQFCFFASVILPATFAVDHSVSVRTYWMYLHHPHSTCVGEVAWSWRRIVCIHIPLLRCVPAVECIASPMLTSCHAIHSEAWPSELRRT
jgi:hypothetical protein